MPERADLCWVARDGTTQQIHEMRTGHVRNALEKVEREGWRSETAPRLRQELEARTLPTTEHEFSYVFSLRSRPFEPVVIDRWLDVSCYRAAQVIFKMRDEMLPEHETVAQALGAMRFAARANGQDIYKVDADAAMTPEVMERYLNTNLDRAHAAAWLRNAVVP